jgi:hypothetical protein
MLVFADVERLARLISRLKTTRIGWKTATSIAELHTFPPRISLATAASSRKTTDAITAVSMPSRFSSSELVAAGVLTALQLFEADGGSGPQQPDVEAGGR